MSVGFASVDTETLLQIAVELAGLAETPPDAHIYNPGTGIRRILFSRDISSAELLIARTFGFDAVAGYQPVGLPRAWRAFERHVALLEQIGVMHEEAVAAVQPGLEWLRLQSYADATPSLTGLARFLDIPMLTIRQPLDELSRQVLQATVSDLLEGNSATTLQELAAALDGLPELAAGGLPAYLALGAPDAPVGAVAAAPGAIAGDAAIAACYFRHGIQTLICDAASPEVLARLRADGAGQLILTGMAAAAIGCNRYCAALRERGIEVETTV